MDGYKPVAEEVVAALKVGDSVKVGRQHEWFWCKITELQEDSFICEVGSLLCCQGDLLTAMNLIRLYPCNILVTDTKANSTSV